MNLDHTSNTEMLHNSISPSIFFKLMVKEEKKILILEAAAKAAFNELGEEVRFSTNDVYRNICLPGFKFIDSRSTSWKERTDYISPQLIRNILRENGYSSLELGGGINVSRWHKDPRFQGEKGIIDADQLQEDKLHKMILEKAAAAKSQAAIIEA